jgi:hypothetical protein
VIPPGGYGRIALELKGTGAGGRARFRIYGTWQRATPSDSVPYVLAVTGHVVASGGFEIVPGRLSLGQVIPGVAAFADIRARDANGHPARLLSVRSASCRTEALLESSADQGSAGRQRLGVRFMYGRGPVQDTILVETGDPKSPTVALLVDAEIDSAVLVDPEALFLGLVPAEGFAAGVRVASIDGTPVRVDAVVAGRGNLTAQASKVDEGGAVWRVAVASRGSVPSGVLSCVVSVRVTTQSGGCTVVGVPVVGLVAGPPGS